MAVSIFSEKFLFRLLFWAKTVALYMSHFWLFFLYLFYKIKKSFFLFLKSIDTFFLTLSFNFKNGAWQYFVWREAIWCKAVDEIFQNSLLRSVRYFIPANVFKSIHWKFFYQCIIDVVYEVIFCCKNSSIGPWIIFFWVVLQVWKDCMD